MNRIKIQNKSKREYKNISFIAFILLICILLLFIHNRGKQQDEKLLNDYSLYGDTDLLMQEGKNDLAINLLQDLHTKYGNDYNITYRLGYAYLNMEQYSSALTLYTKTLDLNPYLVENSDFMYQYALVLANLKQVDNAIIVIDKLLTLPMEESLKPTVIQLKDTLSNLKGTTS